MSEQSRDSIFTWFTLIKSANYFLKENYKKYYFWFAVISVVFFYKLVPPYIVGSIVDFFGQYKAGDSLQRYYYLVATLGISWFAISYLRLTSKFHLGRLAIEACYNAKVEGFDKLMEFSLKWHTKENTGNKMQRIQAGVVALKDLSERVYQRLLPILTSFVGVIFVFLFLDYRFLLAILCYLIVFFSIKLISNKKIERAMHQSSVATEDSSGSLYEGVSNVLTIKSLGAADSMSGKIRDDQLSVRERDLTVHKLYQRQWKYFQLTNAFAIVGFLLLTGHAYLEGSITVGAILIYFSYFQNVAESAGEFANLMQPLTQAKIAIARMMPIYWETENEKLGTQSFPVSWQQLSFDNVSFAYPTGAGEYHLKNVSLNVPHQKKIGVVGESGSGKSTIVKLLLGLYKPQQGKILIDQLSINDIEHRALLKHTAVVLQETELFNATLWENITLMREISPELVAKAIHIADLQPVIDKLPEGVNSLIGERGYRVSGGERQRIGIARAICKQPEILILDEATASLDSETELNIQTRIDSELTAQTMVIVAHRLSTLRNVDYIYVFDKGQVAEHGTFEQLLSINNSQFAKLYNLQQKFGLNQPLL